MAMEKREYHVSVSLTKQNQYSDFEVFDFQFNSLLEAVELFVTMKKNAHLIPQPEEYDPLEVTKTNACELTDPQLIEFNEWWKSEIVGQIDGLE